MFVDALYSVFASKARPHSERYAITATTGWSHFTNNFDDPKTTASASDIFRVNKSSRISVYFLVFMLSKMHCWRQHSGLLVDMLTGQPMWQASDVVIGMQAEGCHYKYLEHTSPLHPATTYRILACRIYDTIILYLLTRDEMRFQAIDIADGLRAYFNIRFICFLNLTKFRIMGHPKLRA